MKTLMVNIIDKSPQENETKFKKIKPGIKMEKKIEHSGQWKPKDSLELLQPDEPRATCGSRVAFRCNAAQETNRIPGGADLNRGPSHG